MLIVLLSTFAHAAPSVDLGAHLDLNHAQTFGVSRVGLGLDATVRLGANERFGVQGFGWEALVNSRPIETVLTTGGLPDVQLPSRLFGGPQRGAGLVGVWTPLQGDVGGLPLAVDLMSGVAVLSLPRGLQLRSAVPAGVVGTGARMTVGRAGALRLRARFTGWLDDRPRYDLTVPVTRSRLQVLATPEVGWVVRI